MINSFKWMIVPCCILVGVGAGSALADCGNGSLSGQYASRSQGSVIGVFDSSGVLHPLATPQIVTGVGQNTFDGNGSFVRSDVAVNSGVTLGSPTPLTDTGFRDEGGGTYKIDADCTGVMSLFVPGGMEIDFAIVVADSGRIVTGTVVEQRRDHVTNARLVGRVFGCAADEGEIERNQWQRRLMNEPCDDAAGRNHPLHSGRVGRLRRECGDRHRRSSNEATQTSDHDRLSSRWASLTR